jgi:hypothetical protein
MVITAVSYKKLTTKNVFTADSYGETAVMRTTSSLPVGKMKRR